MTDTNNNSRLSHKQFHLFPKLSEELKIHIISFVADAPFELRIQTKRSHSSSSPSWESSLTHTIPYVCKEFHAYCQLEIYWYTALQRMINSVEPELWKSSLLSLIHKKKRESNGNDEDAETTVNLNTTTMNGMHKQNVNDDDNTEADRNETIGMMNDTGSSTDALLETAYNVMINKENNNNDNNNVTTNNYRTIFESILNNEIRYTYPLFGMPSAIQLNEPYGLHLFEPRYRLLIAEVMRDYPSSAKNGSIIDATSSGSVPLFVHANRMPLKPDQSVGVIVRILRCAIHQDGRADVLLLPMQYVSIEHLWVRPNSGNLLYSQVRIIGSNEMKNNPKIVV